MTRAAILPAILALASLTSLPAAGNPAPDSARSAPRSSGPALLKPALQAVRPASTPALAPAASAAARPGKPPLTAQQPQVRVPGTAQRDSLRTPPGAAQPGPRQDSAVARQYKVGQRAFNRDEGKRLMGVLNFKAKGNPESTAVNWVYRDERGALMTYEQGLSEWAYAYDSVPFLDPKEYVPDSLIRTRTDGLLKSLLKGKADQYAFVNFEKTMVQARDTTSKEGAAPAVPAYYVGRYLRKLNGRYILGENFQVRLSVGRGNALNYLSYREPALTDSSLQVKVPTAEGVKEYLSAWAKDRSRLGRRIYPYHPDKLRIRSLKPVQVFESYVLVQEKFRDKPSLDGTYLSPRVTVLAEAVLVPSKKRLSLPAPPSPVLLHFHFPCTPAAGLCWPDGPQGFGDGPRPGTGPRPPSPSPSGMKVPAESRKGGRIPGKAVPAPTAPVQETPSPSPTAPSSP